MSIVLDNSVTMRWCFGDGSEDDLAYAARVARQMRTDTAFVPSIWGLEVANVMARGEARGDLPDDVSAAFLKALHDMRITVDSATADHALEDTLALACQHQLSAYDAAYLELALRIRAPLATLDARLRQATVRARGEIFAA